MAGEPSSRRRVQRVKYQEFRIEVQDLRKVKVTRPNGVPLEGDVRWDQLTKDMFEVFDRQLSEGRICYPQELTVIGSQLYRTLFSERIAQAFEDDFRNIRDKKKDFDDVVMRLKLEFQPDADELAKLPWEYLYVPESDGSKGRFIAAEEQLVLTRFVPRNRSYADHPGEQCLRILAVVSAPERELTPDSSELDPVYKPLGTIHPDPVIGQLDQLHRDQPKRFDVRKMNSPTRRALTAYVKEFEPHVLHFIGHGKYGVRSDEGCLAMVQEDDPKTARWVNDTSFAACFQGWTPRLVFLQACKGARTESYNIFRGMALSLVGADIGAVVAMQYEVENLVANRFAARFYQALSEGEPIDQAVQSGRRELGLYIDEKVYIDEERTFSNRDFGSPVVFLQTASGVVVTTTDKGKGGQGESYEPRPCPWGCEGILRSREKFCPVCHNGVVRCPSCAEWNCVQSPVPAASRGSQVTGPVRSASSTPSGSFPVIGVAAAFFCTICGYTDDQGAAAPAPPAESVEPAERPALAGTLNAARGPVPQPPMGRGARLA